MSERCPYDYLPSYWIDGPELFTFLENSPRTDYIVTIMIDGEGVNELLLWENDAWLWANDWYEGEDAPTWSGIVALEDVRTYKPDAGETAYKWYFRARGR